MNYRPLIFRHKGELHLGNPVSGINLPDTSSMHICMIGSILLASPSKNPIPNKCERHYLSIELSTIINQNVFPINVLIILCIAIIVPNLPPDNNQGYCWVDMYIKDIKEHLYFQVVPFTIALHLTRWPWSCVQEHMLLTDLPQKVSNCI